MMHTVEEPVTHAARWLRHAWRENRTLVVLIALMGIFRSALADWNSVPSGSMTPTILAGDRLLVNKVAYDLHLPFTLLSLFRFADPARGDIVVFESAASPNRLVKRVVGIPGDRVQMRDNALYIDGRSLEYTDVARDAYGTVRREELPGVGYLVRLGSTGSPLSSFPQVVVPAGFYLVLGDNRDNSADSRVIGFVARDDIVGRTRSVMFSFDCANYCIPRRGRFLQAL